MHEFTTFIFESPVGLLYCIGLLAIGIWFLAKGGDYLVTGGLSLAIHLEIKTMVVGLTIIAFSTSSPELAFNIFAASGGHGEITIGNIFGSNIANLALVLGIGALVHNQVLKMKGKKHATRIDKKFLKKEGRWMRDSTVGISVLVGLFLLFGNTQESWLKLDWIWGAGIFIIFVLFFWHVIIRNSHKTDRDVKENETDLQKYTSLPKAIFLLIGGFILLILGGKSAEIGAVVGARIIGISEIFIGVTIVAIATSLPELITTIIAAKRDEAELIWGNIVGSNIFNVLFVLPITLIVAQFINGNFIQIASPSSEPWVYMIVMLVITFLANGFMKKDKDISNREGYSLVGLYFMFLFGVTIWKSIG